MFRKLTVLTILIAAVVACSSLSPLERAKHYRSGYRVNLLGFNVKSDDAGNPIAVNMEVSVENRNADEGLSVLTLRVRQYAADNSLLGEDLLALPLGDLKPYQKERYYPILKKIHGKIAAVSVVKAPMDDPKVYMKYRELEHLPEK
ncbi:MAG: hypothetical protein DRJ08_04990 [Acidobacteria bacterium]|nr:MAG: hypothetical protein DRJ08_04990 [Acidobacteriota bacterium]